MPFTHGKWWFIITYLELYFLSPILNAAIEMFDKRKHRIAILIFGFVTLYMGYCRETGEDTWGTSLSHFLWLYMIARYIYKYVSLDAIRAKRWWWFWGFLLASGITFGLSILGSKVSVPIFLRPFPYCSPWTLIAAISALLFALSFRFESRVVNWFAGSSLPCYLFQDCIYFSTIVLYPTISVWLLGMPVMERYAVLLLLAIAFMMAVIIVDKLLGVVLYKPVLSIYDKLYDRIVPQSLRNML